MLLFQQAFLFFLENSTPKKEKKKLPFHHVHFPSPMNPKESDLLTETHAEK